jgi:hypothetical protein
MDNEVCPRVSTEATQRQESLIFIGFTADHSISEEIREDAGPQSVLKLSSPLLLARDGHASKQELD